MDYKPRSGGVQSPIGKTRTILVSRTWGSMGDQIFRHWKLANRPRKPFRIFRTGVI